MNGHNKKSKDFICAECGFNCTKGNEIFYLDTTIWYRITQKKWGKTTQNGILCISCCEKFLGRRLTKRDFSKSYVNKLGNFRKSARLINRLTLI